MQRLTRNQLLVLQLVVILAASGFGYGSKAFAASVDYFLEIEGIPGESETVPGAIEILSWSWGMSNSSAASGGGGGAGKVSMQDFHFTKTIDKSSPKLYDRCCTGVHFPKATLTLRVTTPTNDGLPPTVQLTRYTLEDCLVSSISIGGSQVSSSLGGSDLPMESLSLNFTKVTVEYSRTGSNPAEESTTCLEQAPVK